jgi:aldehyde dehydrogenase (NAD+)
MTTIDTRVQLLRGGLVIGDEWLPEGSAGTMDHVNPATGAVQATFPLAGPKEVDAAVAAARGALPIWKSWPASRRRAALQGLGNLVLQQAEELATINALETGSPFHGFQERLKASFPAWFEYYAGWIDKLTGDTVQLTPGLGFDFTALEPIGVVAKVLTWNTPLVNIQMSVAAALAAGCTVVLKPAELAPFACIRFGQLCLEAGLPPGTVNVVPGGPEAGQALVGHPGVDKVSFTGGLATAVHVQRATADSVTPMVMELGGKSANIVFADADLARAGAHASGVVRLAGQACTLPTRLLVHQSIHDEMVERVATLFIVTGGERLGGELADGFFISPTLVTGVDNRSDLAQQEVFGPVLTVIPFADEEQAVAMANDTQFGLAGYIHTSDIDRALRVASQLEVGNVGINGGGAPAGYQAPFGGFGDSGYGKEGGREGIMEFVRTKNVNIALS